MDELIGRTLKGTFEIKARLGEGAMGTVYRAVDTETGRSLAIKIMQPARMREPGMLTRFRREATAMRRVRHPNAVEVVAHGVDQGLVYLAMELVEGVDLAEHLRARRRLAPERAARIVAEVLGALAEAHAHGVIHRDIKPENIMLGGATGETARLIDFGIAKPTAILRGGAADEESVDHRSIHDSIPDDVDLVDALELTAAGTLVGSPGYMAPEQWSSSAVDGRTDVYACGVLLYQLVTGRLPFEDSNPFMVAQRQLYEEPLAPHEICHEVPLSLSAIVLRAMAPRREDRFQSASDMRDALRAFLIERTITGGLPLDATVPVDVTSPLAGRPALPPPEPLRALAGASPARTPPLPDDAGGGLGRTLILDEAAPRSVHPAARMPSRPPAGGALVLAPVRVALPLVAAFLTLGFVFGLLFFLPLFR